MQNYGYFFKKVMDKAYSEMTKKYSLTNNELAIISYLSSHENNTASDIAAELLFTKSHISLSVDTLTKKGYILKEADTCDKKVIHLSLTELTGQIVKELSDRRKEIETVFFQDFTDTEKEQLQKSLQKITNNIINSNLLQ